MKSIIFVIRPRKNAILSTFCGEFSANTVMSKSLFCATNLGILKFPFSYLAHVMLLAPAQVRLRICSG